MSKTHHFNDGSNPTPTNYTTVTEAEPLEEQDFQGAEYEEGGPADRPYYAIKRESGVVGGKAAGYDPTPKLLVLYASRDGTRSFQRHYHAERADDHARIGFKYALKAVLQRDPDHGKETKEENIEQFRDLVEELHFFGLISCGGDR